MDDNCPPKAGGPAIDKDSRRLTKRPQQGERAAGVRPKEGDIGAPALHRDSDRAPHNSLAPGSRPAIQSDHASKSMTRGSHPAAGSVVAAAAPGPPGPPPPLGEVGDGVWTRHWSNSWNRPYYFNCRTGNQSWELPPGPSGPARSGADAAPRRGRGARVDDATRLRPAESARESAGPGSGGRGDPSPPPSEDQ